MKKILSLFLIAILTLSLLSGCAKKAPKETNSGKTPVAAENAGHDSMDSSNQNGSSSSGDSSISNGSGGSTGSTTGSNGQAGSGTGSNSSPSTDGTGGASEDADGPTTTTPSTTKPSTTKPTTPTTPATKPPVVTVPPVTPPDPTKYQDGSYTAFFDFVDGSGWKPMLNIVISGGKITSAIFDYIKIDGTLKSTDAAYAASMKAKTGVTPAEASARLGQSLVTTQDITKVDTVAGATSATNNFKVLGATLLTKAQSGDKSPAVLGMNATYKATGIADSKGWRPEIAVTFENGVISKVVYNEINQDTQVKKREDASYSAKFGKDVNQMYTTFENQLVAAQSINGVDSVAGATKSSTNFKDLAVQAIAKRSAFIDGTYKASYDYVDAQGWKPFLDIMVKAGKIVSAVFDYIKPDGSLKSADATYAANMKAKTGVTPAEASASLQSSLVESQDIEKVDSVAGATSASNYFVEMGTPLLNNSLNGNTTPVVLNMNATYKAAGTADASGWKSDIAITYENGKITRVVYNETNVNTGVVKRTDSAYSTTFMTKKGVTFTVEELYTRLESQLVEKQAVDGVDMVAGATSSSTKFKDLAAQAIAKRK